MSKVFKKIEKLGRIWDGLGVIWGWFGSIFGPNSKKMKNWKFRIEKSIKNQWKNRLKIHQKSIKDQSKNQSKSYVF